MKKSLFIFIVLILCSCILLLCCTIVAFLFVSPFNINPVLNDPVEPTVINEEPIITAYPESDSELSIYNDQLEFQTDEQVYVSEMYLLEQVVAILKPKDYSYKDGDELPISSSDLNSITINKFLEMEEDRDSDLTIPVNLEYLYISDEAQADLEALILKARGEYLDFLISKGVAGKYIEEINNNAFPASTQRFTYHPINDPNPPPSATEALEGPDGSKDDFSKLEMDIYPVDIYNNSRTFEQSGIIGPKPISDSELPLYYRKLRDMGCRYLIYHEMGHVIQKAFDTVNTDVEHKKLKSSWINAERSLYKLTDKYSINWSDLSSTNEMNNRVINNESQADGVAFQVITDIYNMSEVQSRLSWEFLYNRLATARDQWDESMSYFESEQPDLGISDLSIIIFDSLDNYYTPGSEEIILLLRLTGRLGALPAYGGYFHPMLPKIPKSSGTI